MAIAMRNTLPRAVSPGDLNGVSPSGAHCYVVAEANSMTEVRGDTE